MSHSISIDRFQVEWDETLGTGCGSVFLFPQKGKKGSKSQGVTLDEDSRCLPAKGPLRRGGPHPRGDYHGRNGSDPRARVCKVTQAGWSLCCPEIIWTGLELVSTTQITGKQDIFTENGNKTRTWKVMFLYILYTIIIFCRPQGEKKDIMEAKISVKSEQISYPAFSPHY